VVELLRKGSRRGWKDAALIVFMFTFTIVGYLVSIINLATKEHVVILSVLY
jgi:hypothetical protein